MEESDPTSEGVYSTFISGGGEKDAERSPVLSDRRPASGWVTPHDCPTVCLVAYVVNDFLRRSQHVSALSGVGAPQRQGRAWEFTWVAATRGHSWGQVLSGSLPYKHSLRTCVQGA